MGSLDVKHTMPSPNIEDARTLLKNPVTPLPKFSSTSDEDITRFFHIFEETTNRYKYPSGDKFLLLKQQVSGRGALLLDSLSAGERSYEEAKKVLTFAFASSPVHIFNTIRQISEMKLNYEDEPFVYIGKIKTLSESVHSLKITQDHFLQYFFWNGLNENFRSHLVQITGNSKPSLAQIKDNLF